MPDFKTSWSRYIEVPSHKDAYDALRDRFSAMHGAERFSAPDITQLHCFAFPHYWGPYAAAMSEGNLEQIGHPGNPGPVLTSFQLVLRAHLLCVTRGLAPNSSSLLSLS